METYEKKKEADLVILSVTFVAFIINILIFTPLLKEQIKTGMGFGTNYEMLILVFWFIQLLTVPFVVYGLIHSIYRLVIKKTNKYLYYNFSLSIVTVLMMVFSVWFVFN